MAKARAAQAQQIESRIDPSVFNIVYIPWLDNMARTQIIYGGSASGKSVFAAQRAVHDVLKGERNYLICRAIAKDLRHSTFVEIQRVIDAWNVRPS